MLYAYPKASEESFQDIFFNVQEWLVSEIADGFAAAEATAFVTGNGTDKPTGFLNTTPVTTADGASPERGPGTLQYVPMDSASPQALGADDLIDLVGSVHESYLMDESSVAFVMRRSTLDVVRKLKSTNGDYYWQPSLQQGQPSTLLGYPIFTTDAMQAYVADAHPIAFGNWNRGYLIADRSEIQLTIDSNITTPGQIKFYSRKRVGATILNADSLKLLKLADA
jgi:HK97 family phage major capsid protein